MGQGARTIFAQIAAQELGAPIDWVTVVMGDTAVVPYDQQTSASRSSVLMGNAVLTACRDIQAKLRAMAARLEAVDEATIIVDRGEVRIGERVLPDPRRPRSAGSAGSAARSSASARCARRPSPTIRSAARPRSTSSTAPPSRSRSTARPATSIVARHVTVSDVGKALNPSQVRGQDEGAAVMGLGHTLMEQLHLRRHRADPEPRRHRLPDPDDAWTCRCGWRATSSSTRTGPGPYGSKGMSEGALLCVAPAVAAAVRDAIGVVIRDLPLTPERVWRALQEPRDR